MCVVFDCAEAEPGKASRYLAAVLDLDLRTEKFEVVLHGDVRFGIIKRAKRHFVHFAGRSECKQDVACAGDLDCLEIGVEPVTFGQRFENQVRFRRNEDSSLSCEHATNGHTLQKLLDVRKFSQTSVGCGDLTLLVRIKFEIQCRVAEHALCVVLTVNVSCILAFYHWALV